MNLSTLWTIAQNISLIIALIKKLRGAFESKGIKDALTAIVEYINQIAPPAPTPDSTGAEIVTPPIEKKRRLVRFLNRLNVAGKLLDWEVQKIAAANNIHTQSEEFYA